MSRAVLLAMVPLAACATVPWTSDCYIKFTNLAAPNKTASVPGVASDAAVITENFTDDAPVADGSLENSSYYYINVPDVLKGSTLVSYTNWGSQPGEHKVAGNESWTIDIKIQKAPVDLYVFHKIGSSNVDGGFPESVTNGTNPGWTEVNETRTAARTMFGRYDKNKTGCSGPPWNTSECWAGEVKLWKKTIDNATLTQVKLPGRWVGALAYASWADFCAPTTTMTATATATATTTATATATATTTATATATATNATMVESSGAGGRAAFSGLLAGALVAALVARAA